MLGINNRIDGNHCVDHKTLDYDIIASDGRGPNTYGQIIIVPGNNFTNSNPWANFAF